MTTVGPKQISTEHATETTTSSISTPLTQGRDPVTGSSVTQASGSGGAGTVEGLRNRTSGPHSPADAALDAANGTTPLPDRAVAQVTMTTTMTTTTTSSAPSSAPSPAPSTADNSVERWLFDIFRIKDDPGKTPLQEFVSKVMASNAPHIDALAKLSPELFHKLFWGKNTHGASILDDIRAPIKLPRELRGEHDVLQPARMERIFELRDSAGQTILHHAARKREDLDGIKNLLFDLPDYRFRELLTTPDHEGRMPLHIAAANGCASVFKDRLAKMNDAEFHTVQLLDRSDKTGMTPLHIATVNGQLGDFKKVLAMLDPGQIAVLLSRCDDLGRTVLHNAAICGRISAFKEVLAKLPPDRIERLLSEPDTFGQTPLHFAAVNGQLGGFEDLPNLPPDQIARLLSARDNLGRTPLHFAAMRGDLGDYFNDLLANLPPDLIKQLLSEPDNTGQTPVHYAVANGLADDIVVPLAMVPTDARGGLLVQPDAFGQTPLHLAAANGLAGSFKDLLRMLRSDQIVNQLIARDRNGNTPLDIIGDPKVLKELLSGLYEGRRNTVLIALRDRKDSNGGQRSP